MVKCTVFMVYCAKVCHKLILVAVCQNSALTTADRFPKWPKMQKFLIKGLKHLFIPV